MPREELAEALWGETPPATWEKALSVLVSKLRGLLTEQGLDGASALTSAFGCYRLELPEGSWVDVVAAAEAGEEAEAALAAGDLEKAKETAALAASLVRRPFLPGDEEAWVEEKRRALGEIRVEALAVLADACLLSGEVREATRWAAQVVELEPFREAGYRRLMEAHVAGGNRAEALRVYERCRRLLADELGAYPSPETDAIYRDLLTAPPRADAAATVEAARPGSSDSDAPPPPAPESSARPAVPSVPLYRAGPLARRPVSIGALAAAVAAAVAIPVLVLVLGRGNGPNPALAAVTGDSVGFVDPTSMRLVADPGVGATPAGVAVGDGAIWVANSDGNSVSRIDPKTRAVVQTIAVGDGPSGIAVGAGAVWVSNSLDGTVSRIAPSTNTVVQVIKVGNGPVGVVFAGGSVWVANTGDGTISRIDPVAGKVDKPLPVAGTRLGFGAGSLWAVERQTNQVVRIDSKTGETEATITVGNGPAAIAFGDGGIWVANSLDGTVTRIDPSTNTPSATVENVGDGPSGLAVAPDGVWVSSQFDGTLSLISTHTDQVTRRVTLGSRLQEVALSGPDVLVAVRSFGAGHRGGTLRIRMSHTIHQIDFGLAYSTASWPFERLAGDGLVAFDQTSGLAGTQLVPDLASSLPAPTDGGKTYTFRLRPNIRFSNGKRLRASDVALTFERDFRVGVPTNYYNGIVGGAACAKRPKRCDLSRGIVADDAAGTVSFHLDAPDPEFLDRLALPFAYIVPAGTPTREVEAHSLPGTGPYVIREFGGDHGFTLVRNRYFHEWSKAAQPAGYPDRIAIRFGSSGYAQFRSVVAGHADFASSALIAVPPTHAVLATIKTTAPNQLHENPAPGTEGEFLNTRVAPFDNLDARRALSYAIDRAGAVSWSGGSDFATTTCQILPPDFPGYRPYCPYTSGPQSKARWAAPDLARARVLVERSGTRGMPVTVWTTAGVAGFGQMAAKALRLLGYRVSLKSVSDAAFFPEEGDSRNRPQVGYWGWFPDYPAASNFFTTQFTCASFAPRSQNNGNLAEFCDPGIDRAIAQAVRGEAVNMQASNESWARVDRAIVDQAAVVPLVNLKNVDVVSKRVRNYQFSVNGFGALLDQLWVR